ncbi:MAG: homocysteine S-methyltransferase family protein [Oscillospiraceae bacterium]|nr:homocysteine S-methyltransferase family protein [Oscillospiraceae bacterium]
MAFDINKVLEKGPLIFDGGMGTMLQARGLKPGEASEQWNLTHPDELVAIHTEYCSAGSDIITANTFGVNMLKYDEETASSMIAAALDCAKKAKAGFPDGEKYVALDIGPTGRLLSPFGDLPFEEAVEAYSFIVKEGSKHGADLIIIETMNDSYETKAAVIAAKENCDLPVIASNVYDDQARLLTGADIPAMIAMLEGLGVAALGMNCSLGPDQMKSLLPEFVRHASVPILVMPNAGMPRVVDGKTSYDVTAPEFGKIMAEMVSMGAHIIGGCCGTTPDYIREAVKSIAGIPLSPVTDKNETVVSSYTHAVRFENVPVLVGERINPTGKPKLKEAIKKGDIGYILREGLAQEEKGADILDVNVGLPGIDEAEMLCAAVKELQAVTGLPLQLDTTDVNAMEQAMRCYNGKPLVNSVNGKQESMDAVFPLVKKYGGTLIALTIDETGIPGTAEGRLAIAERIMNEAAKHGIGKKDIIVDPLALTVSSDPRNAIVTLESLRLIKDRLGLKTSLGVSNVSFGLPGRDKLNAAFFVAALESGLGCAIMNPFSADLMASYHSWKAIRALDTGFKEYIAFAAPADAEKAEKKADQPTATLQGAIISGLKDEAGIAAAKLLETEEPLVVINDHIIPALNVVGKGFEDKTIYLPQLLMSAEAAQSAFEKVKAALPTNDGEKGDAIIIATVKGDIHDIGKNIVKALLENFGFNVIDLGRDVDPEIVCSEAIKRKAKLVGLSALMTTTVPAMDETIRLLHEKCPGVKTMVGGAVLTPEYAEEIGADFYAADAMESVRYAQELFGK